MASIRAPVAGLIAKVVAQAGEQVNPSEGLLWLVPDGPRYVEAEVYEDDITKIRLGQRAIIKGISLRQPITGTVSRISPLVGTAAAFALEPSAFTDRRVVVVRVRLDEGTPAATIGALVQVQFQNPR